jgi:hypothetical protein
MHLKGTVTEPPGRCLTAGAVVVVVGAAVVVVGAVVVVLDVVELVVLLVVEDVVDDVDDVEDVDEVEDVEPAGMGVTGKLRYAPAGFVQSMPTFMPKMMKSTSVADATPPVPQEEPP